MSRTDSVSDVPWFRLPRRAPVTLLSVLVLRICSSFIASDSARADRTNGAWLSTYEDNWPLVPVHAALTADGRVLTLGSDSGGTATGFFIYDIWDPAAGLSGGHVTLQNLTQTDIFCGTVVTLPQGGDLLIAGGAEWTGTEVSDVGNNKSTIVDRGDDSLSLGADMNRPRWYGLPRSMNQVGSIRRLILGSAIRMQSVHEMPRATEQSDGAEEHYSQVTR